jgi:hypothetical protein
VQEELQAAKQRVKAHALGMAGIHGVGVRMAENAVAVYVDRTAGVLPDAILDVLAQAAAPFRVVVIREDRASATPAAD